MKLSRSVFRIQYLLILKGSGSVVDTANKRSALAAVYCEGLFGDREGLNISERRGLSIYDIGGDTSANDATPCEPGTVLTKSTRRTMWLSPNRALAVDTADITDLTAGTLNDVSSGRTILRVSGANARGVLAKGCPLDLHASAFLTDHCAQSRIGSLNVLIDHVEEDTFDIYVARGFGLTFWEWLCEAALEYGYRVLPPQ